MFSFLFGEGEKEYFWLTVLCHQKIKPLTPKNERLFFEIGIGFGVVGQAEEVVGGGVVEFGELDEDGGGDVTVSDFVMRIACL